MHKLTMNMLNQCYNVGPIYKFILIYMYCMSMFINEINSTGRHSLYKSIFDSSTGFNAMK